MNEQQDQHDRHQPARASNIELLRSLLEIPSLSGQEQDAVEFLVRWMTSRGFDAFVDGAGNAVGVLDGGSFTKKEAYSSGDGIDARQDLVLLGHIDTVGGTVPVRFESGRLYGRGAVDAKGPLAAFAVAAAQADPPPGWRIVVVGAVEEEAATSRGAHYAASQYRPAMVVIGEPSGFNRVTLAYKGRLLADVTVQRPMSHTAGPEISACEMAVDIWNEVRQRAAQVNLNRERTWDQVLPSLRSFASENDGLIETAHMTLGFRLPLDVGPESAKALLSDVVSREPFTNADPGGDRTGSNAANPVAVDLSFYGEEEAFRGDKNNALVRAFLAAIRAQGERPGFVLKTGTSDMNVVGPLWRCPIVAYGAGDSTLDHTPDEHIDVEEWWRSVAILTDVIGRLTSRQ